MVDILINFGYKCKMEKTQNRKIIKLNEAMKYETKSK